MPTTPALLKTPLGDDVLLVQSCLAREGLSQLGETTLRLLSENGSLSSDDLLGTSCTLVLALDDGPPRHVNGYVTRFSLAGHEGRHHAYEMTLRPWPWLLTRTTDCRIFQGLSVPDIVKQVFQDHPVADAQFKLFRSYRTWDYCVQYRESDYNFVARLLEHEGIYWYFQHTEGGHQLVLTDSASAHDPAPGCDALPWYDRRGQVPPAVRYVGDWSMSRSVEPGQVVLTDYDFERPGASLEVKQVRSRAYQLSDAEVFDYPGGYVAGADGTQYAEDRLDEWQTAHESFRGWTNAPTVAAGALLGLQRHPRDDQNATYLVTGTSLSLRQPSHESSDDELQFSCDFRAIAQAQQFRPSRVTVKPSIPGPQTAVVTGPSGEEIFTDKYGRVKVQFPWDRRGQRDERTSCWVSVSHPWAGANFGGIHLPRIGQEVVVAFLEGDPDRPLIVGRTYNASNMPPWDLPANATQSGILTRSSKGGAYGNANALRFEDKKGAEQLWIHAEKNQDIEVENDETHWVGHDRTKTIDHDETVHVKHDRTETVDHNETIAIGVDRTETVGSNETITIGSNRSEQVGANETIAIGANRTETVAANETITIGANRTITVNASETATVALQRTHTVGINETIAIGAAQEVVIGAAQVLAVGAAQTITVGLVQSTQVGTSQSLEVGANQTNNIGAKQTTHVGADRATSIGGADSLKVGKTLAIEVADSITLKTGSASIQMKSDGTIVIKGKDITLEGSGKINVKAAGDVVVKGSKVGVN